MPGDAESLPLRVEDLLSPQAKVTVVLPEAGDRGLDRAERLPTESRDGVARMRSWRCRSPPIVRWSSLWNSRQ